MADHLENKYPPELVRSSGGITREYCESEKLVNSNYIAYLNEIALEIEQKVWQYTTKEVKTCLGVVNALGYCLGVKTGVIIKRGPERVWDISKIGRLFAPGLNLRVAVSFLSTYLKQYWGEFVYYSQDAVRRIRRILCEDFRLFTQEDRDWSDPKLRTRAPNPCGNVSMIRLLVLANLCEQRLLFEGYKLEAFKLEDSPNLTGDTMLLEVRDDDWSLPQHKAFTLVKLFNLAFKGLLQWGRDTVDDETPLPEALEAIEREWGDLAEPTSMLVDPVPPEPKEPTVSREDWEAAGHGHDPEELVAMLPQKPKRKESLTIPQFAWDQTEEALAWWREQLGKFRWLTKILPDWVMDAVLPF